MVAHVHTGTEQLISAAVEYWADKLSRNRQAIIEAQAERHAFYKRHENEITDEASWSRVQKSAVGYANEHNHWGFNEAKLSADAYAQLLGPTAEGIEKFCSLLRDRLNKVAAYNDAFDKTFYMGMEHGNATGGLSKLLQKSGLSRGAVPYKQFSWRIDFKRGVIEESVNAGYRQLYPSSTYVQQVARQSREVGIER